MSMMGSPFWGAKNVVNAFRIYATDELLYLLGTWGHNLTFFFSLIKSTDACISPTPMDREYPRNLTHNL